MLLSISPPNTTLSVVASPRVIVPPSAVIVPVACRLPLISTFELKLILPVPLAWNVKSSLVPVDSMMLLLRRMPPISAVPWYTTGFVPEGNRLIVELLLLKVLFKNLNVAKSACVVTSKFVVRVVPATSRSY